MTLAPFYSRQRRAGQQQVLAPTYRWDPYQEMEDINRRFGQLIQAFFGDSAALTPMRVTPPVDIEETDDAYVVEVDLPNVRPEDVTIEMLGEELHISGKVQQRETTGVMRRQSRPTGEFEYVVDLPGDIDPDRIEATYDNGVLTVTVAKTRDAHPRRIEVRQSRKQDSATDDGSQPAQRAASASGQPADQQDGQSGGQPR